MMKKSIILILLMLIILTASVSGADRVDMIVLLDNSVSVLPIYNRIQESLVGKIISEHLSPGDTFSLITFADNPDVEISREIKSQDDIDEILAYSGILQPMGNYTDLILALRYLYKYTLDLPLSNRKKIVILTDGIHDPPPGSPYIYGNSEQVRDEVRKAAEEIHREGWDVSIVELGNETDLVESDKYAAEPFDESADTTNYNNTSVDNPDELTSEVTSEAQSGEKPKNITANKKDNLIDTVAEGLGSEPNVFNSDEDDMAGIALGIPLVSIPKNLGKTSGEVKLPLNIQNRSNESLLFSLSAVLSEGNDILKEKTSILLKPKASGVLNIELLLPEEELVGETSREITFKLTGGLKSEPQSFNISYNYQKKGNINKGIDFLFDWRIIALIIAIIAALIIIFVIKKASAASDRYHYSAQTKNHEKEEENPDSADTEESLAEDGNSEETQFTKIENKDVMITKKAEEVFISDVSPLIAEALVNNKNRPIRMLVSGQNTKLGILNTQWLGENKKRTVGGTSFATFRIFFVRVPSVIARIECTGKDFIFYPEKDEFFPELDGPLSECLNKKIKVINQDQKVFYIEFRQWVSELERVNKLLSMTNYTGKPDIEY